MTGHNEAVNPMVNLYTSLLTHVLLKVYLTLNIQGSALLILVLGSSH